MKKSESKRSTHAHTEKLLCALNNLDVFFVSTSTSLCLSSYEMLTAIW